MILRRALPVLALSLAGCLAIAVPAGSSAAIRPVTAEPDGGPAPLTDVVTFYVGLVRPEAQARADWAAATDPTSSAYRRFGTAAEVAERYGASDATVSAFTAAASALGLSAGVDSSRVVGTLTGTVGAFNAGFGVQVTTNLNQDDNSQTWTSPTAPVLPASLAAIVDEVVFSYAGTYVPPAGAGASAADLGDRRPDRPRSAKPRNMGTFGAGCAAARKTGGYSFDQLRTAYGLAALPSSRGAGVRIGIVNAGGGPSSRGLRTARRCWGWPSATVDSKRAPGMTSAPSPTDEGEADVQIARGMADRADIALYDVWESPQQWFLAPLLAYADPSAPTVLSMSYGMCEADLPADAPAADLFDALVVRLGLRGIPTVASAGDTGSACGSVLDVTWPASSPYVVAAGGTRLVVDRRNRRVDEVVWNDSAWLRPDDGGGAGGGGRSARYDRPSYQPAAWVGGTGRGLPDIAAHASQLPSFAISYAGNWITFGGTSASAPLLAAGLAVISQREQARGRPALGPPQGWLYALRATGSAALYDVVRGDNRFVAGVRGFRAAPGYDLASGVGAPRFDRLASAVVPAG